METKVEKQDFVPVTEIKTMARDGLSVLTEPQLVIDSLNSMANSVPDDLEIGIDNLTVYRGKLSDLRQMRYALQNISKSNASILNTLKSENKQYFDDLIDIIEPKETFLRDGVKVVEDEKKRIKTEKVEAEALRIKSIRDDIMEKTNEIIKLSATCETDQHLEDLKLTISLLDEDWLDGLSEFKYMGDNLIIMSEDYLSKAITNIETKKELIKLQKKVEETKRLSEEIEKKRQKEVELENNKRLKEIQVEKEKVINAERELNKIKSEQEDKDRKEVELVSRAKELKNLNSLITINRKQAVKLGAKFEKKEVKYKTIEEAKARIDNLNEILEIQNKFIAKEEWKAEVKKIKSVYGEEIDEVYDVLKAMTESATKDDNLNPQFVFLLNAASESVFNMNNFLEN